MDVAIKWQITPAEIDVNVVANVYYNGRHDMTLMELFAS